MKVKAAVAWGPNEPLTIEEVDLEGPKKGEVLIKVEAAPLNPSDLYCMKGLYDEFDVFKFNYPTVPGWEGAGTVVASGGGMIANR